MNDLMPPPRRRVPDHVGPQVRQLVTAASERGNTMTAHRRWVVPAIVTAAVFALVAGGTYALAGGDGSDQGAEPAGSGQNQPTTIPPEPTPPTTQPAPPPADDWQVPEDEAYARCAQAVRQTGAVRGDGPAGNLEGVVWSATPEGTTVVMTGGDQAVACNVAPDLAVSHPVDAQPPAQPAERDFDFALGAALNVGAGQGDHTWAGGVLPAGVTSVTYAFPDGHEEQAVVQGDHWVMQYLSDRSWSRDPDATVEVRLDGPAGPQTLELSTMPVGQNLPFGCNQVSHGC